MALAYLFEPTTQFQARTGANLTAGFLKVFYTQTDDAAPTYSDFAATPNEEEIVLDADGRAVVIVDDTKTYRLEVYNRNRGLLFTIDPITAMGGGGGGSMVYRVISTDGTVAVETTTSGGITYYDLSTAFTNEASKWGFRGAQIDSLDGSNDWQELPTVSTMGNVPYSCGWKATKDTAYDFAASVELPAGIAGAICGIDVRCDFQVDGVTVDTETGYIDPSRNVDRVSFEFKGQVSEDQKVDAKLYARCAEALTGTLVGRVFYNEECDGIIGGDGGGGDYYAGDFVEITEARVINVTGLQPQSAMSAYATQSALDSCCSSMSSVVSSIQNDVSSISSVVSGITGLTGDFVEKSSISAESAQWNEVSSKVDQSAFDSCCSSMSGYISALQGDVSSLSSTVSGLTGTYVEISSISGYSGIWNDASGMSGKLDESAFTAYTATATAGDFTGVRTDSSLTGNGMPGSALGVNGMELVFDSSMETSISGNSAIVGVGTAITSGFIPTSESGNFQPSGNYVSSSDMSGYVDASSISAASSVWNSASAISSLMPWSSLEGDGTSITAISGSAIGGGGTGGKTYSGIAPVIVDNDADTISLSSRELVFSSPLSAVASGNSAIVSIDLSAYALSSDVSGVIDTVSTNSASWGQGGVDSATVSAIASSYAESAASGKLDSSASSSFYTTANESGFITGVDLSPYQTTAGMSAYQPSGDYIYASSLGTGTI